MRWDRWSAFGLAECVWIGEVHAKRNAKTTRKVGRVRGLAGLWGLFARPLDWRSAFGSAGVTFGSAKRRERNAKTTRKVGRVGGTRGQGELSSAPLAFILDAVQKYLALVVQQT